MKAKKLNIKPIKNLFRPNFFNNAVSRQDLYTPASLLILVVSILTIFIWIISKQNISFIFETPLIFLAKSSAFLGIILLSFNFILATRISLIEKLFGSLEKLYKTHDIIGRLIIIFGFIHLLSLILQYYPNLDSIKILLITSTSTISNLGIFGFWFMIILVILTLFLRFSYEIWLNTHKYFIIAFCLLLLHAFAVKTGDFNNLIALKTWIIYWSILGLISFLYKNFFYKYFSKKAESRIDKINFYQDITEIYLKITDKNFFYQPGQFIFIKFITQSKEIPEKELHPFSISGFSTNNQLRLSIKTLGDYTSKLHNLQIGDKAIIYGPHGDFHKNYIHSKKPMIWIAGGIGSAPFTSMAQHLAQNKQKITKPITFFYTVKHKGEDVYKKELDKIAQTIKNFKVIYIYTSDRKAFLTAKEISKKIGGVKELKKCDILMCGPTIMSYKLSKQFIKLGINASQIEAEEFDFG